MLPLLIPISSLLLSDALLLIGHGLLLTLLPIVATNSGFSDTQVALTGSAYFIGFVLGCLGTPYMVKRVGHIRSFAVMATLYSAIVLVFPLLPEFYSWLLLRLILGFSVSGLYMIIESWLNERASVENRGTILSIYTMLSLLMMMVGQQLLNIPGISSEHLFTLAAILVSLALIPVSLTLTLAPAPLQTVKISLPKVWRHSHIGLIGAVVYGLVNGSFWALAPVYARQSGFDTFQLSMLMSVTVLGGAVFQLPLGRLSDRLDRRIVLIACALVGTAISVGFVVLPMVVPVVENWMIAVLAFLWGGAAMTQYSISLAHANDNAPADDFVEIGSGMLLTVGICSALGAPLASLAMTLMGAAGLYAFAAVCLAAFAVITLVRWQSHSLVVPEEGHEHFRAVADMTTPTAYEMDPRTEEEDEPSEQKDEAA
jgi:MFS family permease